MGNRHIRPIGSLQLVSSVIVTIILLPLLYLFIRASTVTGDISPVAYLTQARTLTIMLNSIVLVVAVTLSAAAIGIPFAWLTTRSDLPLRRVWLVLGLLTMVIPSYLAAVTYLAAFGPVGFLQEGLDALFGIKRLPNIRGFWGAWLAITLFTYPYVVLPVRSALLKSDPALEEAGYSLGLTRWQVFWRITLPQLRPAVASGMLLASLYALSDFGAVAIMHYNAFTRAIFLQIDGFRMERAALLALVLVIFTLILFAAEWRINRGIVTYRIGTGTTRTLKPVVLGAWTLPALLFCLLLVGVGVFVPIGVMLYWVVSSSGASSPIPIEMSAMLQNTVSISVITAVLVAILALPLAFLVVRHNTRGNRWLVGLAYTGNVLPGIVIALAWVYFATHYMNDLYQTVPLLILGYATRFLPYAIAATRSAITQINPRIEEASRSLGRNALQTALRITLPLASTGILAGAALVFLSVMKELPTTLILRPIGYDTFATRIWQFYTEAFLALIGLPGLVLMAVSALGLALLLWRDERQRQ